MLLVIQLKFNLWPGHLQYWHIYILTDLLSFLIATTTHFPNHKDLKEKVQAALALAESTQQSYASESWLPCWQTGHMLYTWHVEWANCACTVIHRQTHTHTQTRTNTHTHTKCACSSCSFPWSCVLLTHVSLIFFSSAFNLAHRWRVLSAPQPSTQTWDTRSWFWKIATWTEKKENRSEAVSGKDDSGESVFSPSYRKRQILKLPGSWPVCECILSCMQCADTIMPGHFIVFVGHLEKELLPHNWAITEMWN